MEGALRAAEKPPDPPTRPPDPAASADGANVPLARAATRAAVKAARASLEASGEVAGVIGEPPSTTGPGASAGVALAGSGFDQR